MNEPTSIISIAKKRPTLNVQHPTLNKAKEFVEKVYAKAR
jgi:hypothetical protein